MPTSTDKPILSQDPTETARILEAVELLLALQEDQAEVRFDDQQEAIIEQLDKLEAKISSLQKAQTTKASKAKEKSSSELGDKQLNRIAKQIEAGLSKKLTERIEALEAKQESFFDSISQAFENAVEETESSDNAAAASSELKEQLELLSEQIEYLTEASTPEKEDPGNQSELAESIQELKSQVESLTEKIESNSESSEPDKGLLKEVEKVVKREVKGNSNKLFQALTQLTSESEEKSDSSSMEDFIVEALDSIQKVDEKVTVLETRLNEAPTHSDASSIDHSEHFEKILERLAELESNVNDQHEVVKLIEGISSISRSDVAEEVQSVTESISSELKTHVEELFSKQSFGNLASSDLSDDVANPEVAPTEDEETASHWHKQKRAMLAKYGIDPDYRPLDDQTPTKKPEADQPAQPKNASTTEKLGQLHDTIQSISPQDNEAVEKLKKELNSKLRDAEVELSINRAKLSQQQAEIEQKQAELEQKAADLEARLAAKDDNQETKKESLMSRFARHLGRRK